MFSARFHVFAVLIILLVGIPETNAQGSWNTVTSPTTNWLYSVFMVSASDGWAVGISILHYTGPTTQTPTTAASAAPTGTTTPPGGERKPPSIADVYMVLGALVVVLVVVDVMILVGRRTIRRNIPEYELSRPAATKYCINCGSQIPRTANLCMECGAGQ